MYSDQEKDILIALFEVDDWIRFRGYDDRQTCFVLRNRGLTEMMTWESHAPYFQLTPYGKIVAEKLFDALFDDEGDLIA